MEQPVGRTAPASQPPARSSLDSLWTGTDRHAYGNTHFDADPDFDAHTNGDSTHCR